MCGIVADIEKAPVRIEVYDKDRFLKYMALWGWRVSVSEANASTEMIRLVSWMCRYQISSRGSRRSAGYYFLSPYSGW